MLLMTSIISPSTAAALSAKSSCSGLPAAARRNIAATMTARDHGQAEPPYTDLTVPISAIAAIVAMHGGNTFQTNMFSTVNTALDVAVMRLVSMPGIRSESSSTRARSDDEICHGVNHP